MGCRLLDNATGSRALEEQRRMGLVPPDLTFRKARVSQTDRSWELHGGLS